MRRIAAPLVPGIVLALTGCVVPPPPGPSVVASPGQGKSFAAFQQDDAYCRQYASQQTGGVAPGAAATQSGVGTALAGTALGAATGAAIGAASGAAGPGAAIGAGAGLLAGSLIGANNAAASYGGVQHFYDVNYGQCMTAHGENVQPSVGYAGYYPYAYPYASYYPYPYYPYYSYPYAYPYAGWYGGYGPGLYGPALAIGFGGLWGWGWGGPWHGPGPWRGPGGPGFGGPTRFAGGFGPGPGGFGGGPGHFGGGPGFGGGGFGRR